MLLFHGTIADEERLASIFSRGLQPRDSEDWSHQLADGPRHVFLSTSPVAGWGGDPVAFARGWSHGSRGDGWIIVVDLPAAETDRIVGAIGNGELERWWQTRSFQALALSRVERLVAAARDRRVPVRDLLRLAVDHCATGLVDGEPDPVALLAFADEYPRAPANRKSEVARRYGVRVPDDFATDSHQPWCQACLGQLFLVVLRADDVHEDHGPPMSLSVLGGPAPLDRETVGFLAERTAAWLDACDAAAVAAQRRTREGLTWAWLQRQPVPRDRVPRTMWPDVLTHDLDRRRSAPDTQLLATAIPRERIVGAIRVGSGGRLAASVRPADGETLADTLWRVARELRAAWTGRPLTA